jgi:hypothetical protein
MKSGFIKLVILLFFAGSQMVVAQKSQTREVSAFTEISLRVGANVHLKMGNSQFVEVKGDEATLAKLITEVSNRALVIKYPADSWFSNWKPGRVDIYVTIPQIDGLTISGSGSIVSEDKIESRILNLLISGSGDIKLSELKSEKVIASLSGSGNVHLSGSKAAEFKATISGSGNVKAIDFPAANVDVKISGSGNCWVNAEKNLVARLAGSGNIIYRGAPLVDSGIVGSGSVKKE